MTSSPGRGRRWQTCCASRNSATNHALPRLPSMPIFTAAISQSFAKISSCSRSSALDMFVHRFHALRVLHRQRSNRRNAITSIRRRKSLNSAAVPAPQLGSNPAIVNRIGGTTMCPFVLICLSRFSWSSEENCRSRSPNSWNVPAIANVRADFSERKKNLSAPSTCRKHCRDREFGLALRKCSGEEPRTSVASATRFHRENHWPRRASAHGACAWSPPFRGKARTMIF